jgi:hypothetical protein
MILSVSAALPGSILFNFRARCASLCAVSLLLRQSDAGSGIYHLMIIQHMGYYDLFFPGTQLPV